MQNTTTGDTPGVLLYGANVHTNMPNLRSNRVDNGHQVGQEEGTKKRDAKEKDPTPYNPHHYIQIQGTQIQVEQGLEERRRVTKKWKKVDCRIQQNQEDRGGTGRQHWDGPLEALQGQQPEAQHQEEEGQEPIETIEQTPYSYQSLTLFFHIV